MNEDRATFRLPQDALDAFSRESLQAAGVPPDDAALVARSLSEADARGLGSHGVVRLLPVYVRRLLAGTTRAHPAIHELHGRGAIAVLDGDGGLGQVVGHAAMRRATAAARELGVGAVAVRRSSHFGIGALFVEQAVAEGMVGIVMTNAPANMPPHGGRGRFFGTNPLAVGIPCGAERPIVLDMSTSVVARGKIVMLHKVGQPIPRGWAIDAEGNPTEDAAAALAGAVLPMAGHKGSGLALVIDALCGVLAGAAYGPHIVDLYDEGDREQNVGHFFLALDVEAFVSLAQFQEQMDRLVREVRAQPRQPGVERIYVPGEWEYELAARSRREGVPLPAAGLPELDELAGRLDIMPLSERMRATA
jgi:LDH2 family malate/lactate/ureidoglycolate dehydrogenase